MENSNTSPGKKDEIMSMRPELNKEISAEEFRNCYYLKNELMQFCRENGIPAYGSKAELTERISGFLENGEIIPIKTMRRHNNSVTVITADTVIEPNVVCSEIHRDFFRAQLGKGFTFKVAFQKWLKLNPGRTYGEAVEAYKTIAMGKTQCKEIDRQFEYNTYIRDFFASNKGLTLQDAITCWKFKKSVPGHNRYEKSDLQILEK